MRSVSNAFRPLNAIFPPVSGGKNLIAARFLTGRYSEFSRENSYAPETVVDSSKRQPLSGLEDLRRISEDGKRHQLEAQLRNERARVLSEQESKRQQAQREEAVFEAQILAIHEKAAAAASRGENHVIVATRLGSDLGFRGGYFYYILGPPKSVSRNRLSPGDRRLYDYCVQAGFHASLQLHKDDSVLRNGDIPSSWHYHVIIRW
jgi:hypothetical protein